MSTLFINARVVLQERILENGAVRVENGCLTFFAHTRS